MIQPTHNPMWDAAPVLPEPLDSETAMLLRAVLLPIVDNARSWPELRNALVAKGYEITFRQGRFVLVDAVSRKPVCTGQFLGTPLRSLAGRLGRPSIQLGPDGQGRLSA